MARRVIEVDELIYARLLELAGARGVTVEECVAQLARVWPDADRRDIAERTDRYLREEFGFEATAEEREAFAARLAARPSRRATA